MPIFLVEVYASVYDNDCNFIVSAESSEEALKIVQEEVPYITEGAESIRAHLLTPRKSTIHSWKKPREGGKGILLDFSPHAGDPDLGE